MSARELWLREIVESRERRVHEYARLDAAADRAESARVSARPFDDWCVCGEPTRNGLCDRCDAEDRGELYP